MVNTEMIYFLTEKVADNSDDSDTSSWSTISSLKSKSSEEEFDDEDDSLFFPLMQYLIRLRHRRVDDYLYIIDSWTDSIFKDRLRISRLTASKLIDDLNQSGYIASHSFGPKPLEPKLCFYIFLSFIANTEPLTPIATRFDVSISSAFRVIRRVIAWLLTKINVAIKWPQTYDEISAVCDTFITKFGIANVLGVIDCTHVKIEKPKNCIEYCNTKGYFSIVLQAVVNADLQFTNIFCGEPGSSNCSRVLKKSPIYNTATQNKISLFPHDTFLIGHSGYPSLPWLVPPFREGKRITAEQKNFNIIHCNTHRISDKAFAMLKKRFRRIKHFTVYRNITFITDTIVAACILHNYCIVENDLID